MKAIALFLGLVTIYTVNAAEVKVMTVPSSTHPTVTSVFKINKDLGRAWVETTIDDRTTADESIGYDEYRSRVEGLAFDQNSSEITLDVDGARVTCATVRTSGRGIFKHDKIKMTGNCALKNKAITLYEDNGFELRKKNYTEIYIVTK